MTPVRAADCKVFSWVIVHIGLVQYNIFDLLISTFSIEIWFESYIVGVISALFFVVRIVPIVVVSKFRHELLRGTGIPRMDTPMTALFTTAPLNAPPEEMGVWAGLLRD